MNLSCIFANALARRLAYVLAALLLAWLGIPSANAQAGCSFTTQSTSTVNYTCGDQGQAYAQVYMQSLVQSKCSGPTLVFSNLVTYAPINGSGAYQSYWACKAANGNTLGTVSIYANYAGLCSSRAPSISEQAPIAYVVGTAVSSGSLFCSNGCSAAALKNADGTWNTMYTASSACTNDSLKQDCSALSNSYWSDVQQACVPIKSHCTAQQVENPTTGQCVDACPNGMHVGAQGECEQDADTCPAGNIRSPAGTCLPGEGQCAQGEAKRKDGTCGRDSDGDGVADDDDDDPDNDSKKSEFSGGDSCDAPPACNGDAILCGQARIQWRIDCNTRHDKTISGGTCGAMPICAGKSCDAMEYSQLLQQWKAACALEKLAGQGSDPGDGNQPAWTKVDGMSQYPGQGETDDDRKGVSDHELSTSDIDQSGFTGGGSCVGLVSTSATGIASGFAASLASPPAYWCQWIGYMKAITILLAAVTCAFLLSKGGNT